MDEVVGLDSEKGNKDSKWVFEIELASSCKVGLDNWLGSSNWQDIPLV